MNMNLIAPICVFVLSAFVNCQAAESVGGIEIPSTRLIYPESESTGISFTVTNNTGNLYLLQSRIIPDSQENIGLDNNVPFIVIPPLTRFEPGESVTLLIRQSGKVTPADRESLWRLALKTIPAQSDHSGRGGSALVSLVLAMQNNLKLLYRPATLPVLTSDQRAGKLIFSADGSMLHVTNPSPYYVTMSELFTDGKVVHTGNDKTIPPHGTATYPTADVILRNVSWSVTDDNGFATERREQLLR